MTSDSTSKNPFNPYNQGTTLDLTALTNIYEIESNGNVLSVRIDHVFLPFTKGQTMRIHALHSSPGPASDIPEVAVLKLYDRRWIDDRTQPWSSAREEEAQARWKAIASGDLIDDFDKLNEDDYTGSHEEERYWRLCQERFETEYEAYKRLSSLQGTTIPQCYGAVAIHSSNIAPQMVAEAVVYGIIIENIDAAPLSSVDLFGRDYSSLGHSLMATLHSFSSHGVIHNDVRSGNILISPERIVLIDFGEAVLRGDLEDDEQWAERVRLEDEVEALRRILHRGEIRDRSPYTPPRNSGFHFNRLMLRERESWRKRWYDQVETVPEKEEDRDKREQLPWWALKEEVQSWLDSRPEPPECFRVPRPGSPDYGKDCQLNYTPQTEHMN